MKSVICLECGHSGLPKTLTPGYFVLEVVLWLCMVIPGLFYSLWRLNSRHKVCRSCHSGRIVPLDSPGGRVAIRSFQEI